MTEYYWFLRNILVDDSHLIILKYLQVTVVNVLKHKIWQDLINVSLSIIWYLVIYVVLNFVYTRNIFKKMEIYRVE